MKKVLIISSSPRKGGNSDVLCNEFAKGAVEAGNSVEQVFLKDKNINYCIGCGACVSNKGVCVQKDDMVELREKMLEADAIVMATPVYFYSMCGQLKTFIDRNCFFYTQVENKDFYFIMTAAENEPTTMEGTLKEFEGYLNCVENPTLKGTISAGGVWQIGDVKSTKYMQEAYEMGKSI